ncbi:MAG: flavodoxin [Prevotellaceae bacterium]|jgi:flavodoxin I|nr:flavodoxin [Prevotellaceae bacterium]
MKKIGIFYGSSTGTTESVAKLIASKLGINSSDIYDVESAKPNLSEYDILLFGASSVGFGDLPDHWENYLKTLEESDLTDKTVALFCCGDSYTYPDSFCGAMRKIYDVLKNKSCTIVGAVPVEGYATTESEAVIDGKYIGLAIDNDNEDNLTQERVENWIGLFLDI